LANPVLFREGLPRRLDPGSALALQKALELKAAASGVEVTAVAIGPARAEEYLRDALALGAEKALRICDEDTDAPRRKALLLAGLASIENPDVILAGARSLDTGNGQVAALTAARLGLPGVGDAVSLEVGPDGKSAVIVRDVGRGAREKVRCPLPTVVSFKGEGKLPYAPLDRLIESRDTAITRLTPADLGISLPELRDEPVRVTGPVSPRPRLKKAPPLDSSLPAFERILQLLQGGISGRKGRMLTGDGEALAGQLFDLLIEAGALKPGGR
jgi:electron transfer flavoprotein beta subunit